MAGVGLIENLKPFQPGNKAPRRSRDVARAITNARKLLPSAVALCGEIIGDTSEAKALRLKAAEVIIDKAMPRSIDPGNVFGDGISELRIVFVHPSGNGHDIDPPHTFTVPIE